MVVPVGGRWGWGGVWVGVSAWCVCRLVPGGGDGMGAALLVVGGAGVGAVLDGSLGIPPGRVGVACSCRAVLAVPGWLRCPGTAGRWLPGHPGGAVVRRQLMAAGGWWCWYGVRVGGLLVGVGCSL